MSGIVYNKKMGFAINGVAIPDPAGFGYKSQSEDTSAERDTTGYLHRQMVATKYNVSLSWNGLDYVTASSILRAVRAPKFIFSFPCPEEENETGIHTGEYYAGDRSMDAIKMVDEENKENWIVSMNFDCIEF